MFQEKKQKKLEKGLGGFIVVKMKEEEVDYLMDVKMKQGKSETQAKTEIRRDIKFLKEQKRKIAKAKHELDYWEKAKVKQKEKFKKEFAKMIKQQERLEKPQSFNLKSNFCNTKYLQRILNYLKEKPQSIISRITKDCLVSNGKTKDGLLFLIKYNLVTKESKHGCEAYSIK